MKKTKFTSYYLLLLACVLSLLLSMSAAAQQTTKISFQGFLKDENGKAVKNDTMTFFFKLFPTATGGTAEWIEKQTLRVTDGIYSVKIGAGTNLVSGGAAQFGALSWKTKQYFIEVTVRNTTLEKRTELTYAPYALGVPRATVADTAYVLKNGIIDTGRKIALSSTATSFADFSDGFQVTNSGTKQVVVKYDNLGIGTAEPYSRIAIKESSTGISITGVPNALSLRVNNDPKLYWANSAILIPGFLEVNTSGNKLGIGTGTIKNGFEQTGDGKFFIKTNDRYTTQFDANGRVGIGVDKTNFPRAILHVKGETYQRTGLASSRYFVYNTPHERQVFASIWEPIINFLQETSQAERIVALFEGDVVSTNSFISIENMNWSDKRLKEAMQISDSKSDLATLAKIEITDYKYIDTVLNGNDIHKKVIAQQLGSVYPNAVSPKRQVLPNVYQLASHVVLNAGKLTITTPIAHGFVKDDDIMLKTPSTSLDKVKVLEVIDAHSFSVETTEKPEQVFVYGKYANDVLAVDYDAVSMLNISATQELARRVKALELAEKQSNREATHLDARLSKIEALLQLNTNAEKK